MLLVLHFPPTNQRPRSSNMWLEIAKGVDAPPRNGRLMRSGYVVVGMTTHAQLKWHWQHGVEWNEYMK